MLSLAAPLSPCTPCKPTRHSQLSSIDRDTLPRSDEFAFQLFSVVTERRERKRWGGGDRCVQRSRETLAVIGVIPRERREEEFGRCKEWGWRRLECGLPRGTSSSTAAPFHYFCRRSVSSIAFFLHLRGTAPASALLSSLESPFPFLFPFHLSFELADRRALTYCRGELRENVFSPRCCVLCSCLLGVTWTEFSSRISQQRVVTRMARDSLDLQSSSPPPLILISS